MTDIIALLRGVNVGGITIRSTDLADTFASLGFEKVRTVLASGNVAFTVPDSTDAPVDGQAARIESALSERFRYDARVVLVERARLASIVDAFPFAEDDADWHPYVLFGSERAALDELLADAVTIDEADDRIAPGDGVIYWHNRRGIGVKSAFSRLAQKARYRSTTNRNVRTLRKLLG